MRRSSILRGCSFKSLFFCCEHICIDEKNPYKLSGMFVSWVKAAPFDAEMNSVSNELVFLWMNVLHKLNFMDFFISSLQYHIDPKQQLSISASSLNCGPWDRHLVLNNAMNTPKNNFLISSVLLTFDPGNELAVLDNLDPDLFRSILSLLKRFHSTDMFSTTDLASDPKLGPSGPKNHSPTYLHTANCYPQP